MIDALAARGYETVPEPGRRIVQQEVAGGGCALPWTDMDAFLHRAMETARQDLESVQDGEGWTFFDRGLVDAASGLVALGTRDLAKLLPTQPAYFRLVFFTPPWREIYVEDAERQHGFSDAVAEYERLMRHYPEIGYKVVELPKVSVIQRVDFLLARLDAVAGEGG